jgi:hypothetical protein
MAEAAAIYQRYSDNVARLATITIETGVDPGDANYGPAALVDDNPAKVAKIDSLTGAWQFAYAAKQPVALVGLVHHDFDAGANVKIQGDDGPNWAAPAFSAAITIPAWLGSGTRRWPVNPRLDLTEADGYDEEGWQYYRLLVTTNSQNVQLGQAWLGETIRRLDPHLHWKRQHTNAKRYIRNRTAYDVETIYSRGTNLWRLEGTHGRADALQALLEAQWFDVDGAALPWLFVPNSLENRCYLVRWGDEARAETQLVGPPSLSESLWEQRLVIAEVARGLRPGV